MIDKMKEVAIKQFQQQQDIINEKNREITYLIENKNKEVSTVIQERKRSLDEKSKEVSKITQEKFDFDQRQQSELLRLLKKQADDVAEWSVLGIPSAMYSVPYATPS